MIASLRGEVLERWDDSTVLLGVNGVGYAVTVLARTLAELEPTSAAYLYIHHHIREDDQTLYGFASRDELRTFTTLLGAHGVGPALALAIMGTFPPTTLVEIVAGGDHAALTAVPGVGRKTAERLLVELKGRLSLPLLDGVAAGSGAPGVVGTVREALAGLGYAAEEINQTLRELGGTGASNGDPATVLRDALKVLGARRA